MFHLFLVDGFHIFLHLYPQKKIGQMDCLSISFDLEEVRTDCDGLLKDYLMKDSRESRTVIKRKR